MRLESNEAKTARLNSAVVATVDGHDVTRAQLAAMFDKVKPAGDWRKPIDATVRLDHAGVTLMHEAVLFYTGGRADIEELGNGSYRVRAAGHRAVFGR